MQHVLILRCMYLCQSCFGPGAYQVPSYASAARVSRGYMVCTRARVAWLQYGLRACRVVTCFAPVRVSHGYMVCARARVTWLHGLPCPSPSLAACGRIRELQRCSVSSINTCLLMCTNSYEAVYL